MKDNLSFYDEFAAEYCSYYQDLRPVRAVEAYCSALIAANAMPDVPGLLLDLGCGPGAHFGEWSSKGFEVKGLDSSPNMLSRARRNADAGGLIGITLYCADVSQGPTLTILNGAFQLIAAHFNFLNLFSHSELATVLNNISGLLQPGGIFVTDTTVWTTDDTWSATEVAKDDFVSGDWRLVETRWDGMLHTVQRDWSRNGEAVTETMFAHQVSELSNQAAAIGLKLLAGNDFELDFAGELTPAGQKLDHRLFIFRGGQVDEIALA
jgi:SAM-dependent methyltransferase